MTMIASYNWESDSFTQHSDTPARVAFRTAVLHVADKAKLVLPDNASRIDKAIALVLRERGIALASHQAHPGL